MNQEEMLDDLAARIQKMQAKAREIALKRQSSMPLKRGFHAKGTGVRARFRVNPDIPNHPWNTKEITPLGLINLSRKKAYDASAINRGVKL